MDSDNPLQIDPETIGINLNRNLSRLMENNCISLSVLHRNTGIAIPTIKRLQSDPTTNPTITTLIPIANFFGVTIVQLIGNDFSNLRISGYIENRTNWLKVPLIGWKQTINWNKSEKIELTNDIVLADIDAGKFPYALKVEKDDWPEISKGSILIINSEILPEHKDYAIVYKSGQTPTLKQVLIEEEKIFLKSLNPYFPPSFFDESYKFLGVLMQIRKDTKV